MPSFLDVVQKVCGRESFAPSSYASEAIHGHVFNFHNCLVVRCAFEKHVLRQFSLRSILACKLIKSYSAAIADLFKYLQSLSASLNIKLPLISEDVLCLIKFFKNKVSGEFGDYKGIVPGAVSATLTVNLRH